MCLYALHHTEEKGMCVCVCLYVCVFRSSLAEAPSILCVYVYMHVYMLLNNMILCENAGMLCIYIYIYACIYVDKQYFGLASQGFHVCTYIYVYICMNLAAYSPCRARGADGP
jgi:hypothetical protein